MKLRVLSRADVEAALDLDALVDELAAAFAALSAGEASMPPRAGVEVPGAGSILMMGAHRHESPSVTVKLVSIFPGHDPAHQAAIVVFDAATGTPAALMDGDAITAARTAAGSRLATRLLAREDADVLAVIGTGVQGDAHLAALTREREWAEVRVFGRRKEAARELAARHDATPSRLRGGRRPRRRRRLRRHRGHGARAPPRPACPRGARQLRGFRRPRAASSIPRSSATRSSSSSHASPRSPHRPPAAPTSRARTRTRSSASSWPARKPGRTSPEQLTLYKSVGVGLEDDAAAHLALAGAERRGVGRFVEL